MNSNLKRLTAWTLLIGSLTGLTGCRTWGARLHRPVILSQPQSQVVALGDTAMFSVTAEKLPPFQWEPIHYRWQVNKTPDISTGSTNWLNLSGGTNSTNVIVSAALSDVGYYRVVVIGSAEVISDAASLTVYTSQGGGITLFGSPILSSGGSGTCPGPYVGYVNYKKALPDWGWAPAPGSTHTATDTTRTDTKAEISGSSGDRACGVATATITGDPPRSAKYRFTIYFPQSVPTGSYPINLTGFNP